MSFELSQNKSSDALELYVLQIAAFFIDTQGKSCDYISYVAVQDRWVISFTSLHSREKTVGRPESSRTEGRFEDSNRNITELW